jgi:hypothetical protein
MIIAVYSFQMWTSCLLQKFMYVTIDVALFYKKKDIALFSKKKDVSLN